MKPQLRRDLDLFPLRHEGKPFILVRDHLGLIEEGRAVPIELYELMSLMDGTRDLRDIQMVLMRQKGGTLVGVEEIEQLVAYLDELYLLESQRYEAAKEDMAARFAGERVRACSHCGQAYPNEEQALRNRLDEILAMAPATPGPGSDVVGIIAPHIDLNVGARVYGSAYGWLRGVRPSRVVVLGIGHQMREGLFCLTEKDFCTPLGTLRTDRPGVQSLLKRGTGIITKNDFDHKGEHSIEFQTLFIQHLLPRDSFEIIPILCGNLKAGLASYTREDYLQKAGPFIKALTDLVVRGGAPALVVAGVDFSHVGPKFGHPMTARAMEPDTRRHDQNLLKALSEADVHAIWAESRRVEDQFNVCGFSAMACLLEVLGGAKGRVLDYELWHEEATQSAVSFAAAVYMAPSNG